jgi:hypothetical protein
MCINCVHCSFPCAAADIVKPMKAQPAAPPPPKPRGKQTAPAAGNAGKKAALPAAATTGKKAALPKGPSLPRKGHWGGGNGGSTAFAGGSDGDRLPARKQVAGWNPVPPGSHLHFAAGKRPLELTMCRNMEEYGDCRIYKCPRCHSRVGEHGCCWVPAKQQQCCAMCQKLWHLCMVCRGAALMTFQCVTG